MLDIEHRRGVVKVVLEGFVTLNDDRSLGVLFDGGCEVGHDDELDLMLLVVYKVLITDAEWGQYPGGDN